MSASNVAAVFRERPASAGSPTGVRLAAVCYGLIAVAPVPLYFLLRAFSGLPDERWAGTTPFDDYLGVGLLYFGGAAVCSYLLFQRRAAAVWPAALVAAWKALEGVAALRWGQHSFVDVATTFGACGLLVLLALFVRKLHRKGVLR